MVSNNCTDGVREQYTAKPQKCPGKAPRGLRIVTADGKLTAEQGHNVTLMVQLEEVGQIPSPLCLPEPVIFPQKPWFCLCLSVFVYMCILPSFLIFFHIFILLLHPWFLLLFHLLRCISSLIFISLQIVLHFYLISHLLGILFGFNFALLAL